MSSHHARVPVPTSAAPAAGGAQQAAPAAPEALHPAAATLTVGAADDRAEHAADALADAALARLDGADPHRHTPGCGHLRRSFDGATGAVGAAGGDLDADVTSRVEAARGGGTRLPAPLRRRMESAFGTDLGHVRVHTGPEAGRLSRAMSAEAFTTGDDIFFGHGRYAPHDPVGEKVLAHEIAHVVQETGSRAVRRFSNPFKKLFGGSSAPPTAKELAKQKVKESKVAEKAELTALAEDRAKGEQGRANLSSMVHDDDGLTSVTAGDRMDVLWARFDKALAFEIRTYRKLLAEPGATPETAARDAYDATWHGKFRSLESVRPPRETAAERLMVQVRSARHVAERHSEAMESEEEELAETRLMSSEVEGLYDRMVAALRTITQAEPDLHPELARDKASRQVRDGLVPKVAGTLPVRNSVLDREAWARAEQRAPILEARRARTAQGLAANLATLDKLDAKVETAESVGGTALSGIEAGGQQIADLKMPDLKDSPGGTDTHLPESVDGGAVDAVSRAVWRKKNGVRSDDDYEKLGDDPLSTTAGKAKEGIGAVTGILGGLLTAVREAFATARSVRDAWKQKDPYGAMKATKSGASAVDGLVSAAKSTANLAKVIDTGVADGVAKVVPGLDIAAAALSMVKAVSDVAVAGMRQHETDTVMFEARAQRTGKNANVMVWPLMNVSRSHTKNLENTTWALGSSVADLGLSIGQVASAGGFGIPAAIKGVKAVIDNVHSLGHFIADEVFVVQAKTAERESAVQHLEGGAENELRRHPKAAVDGIVLRAAGGDPLAEMFLANYRVHGKPVGRDLLDRIRPRAVTVHDPRRRRADGLDFGDAAAQQQTTDDGALAMIREAVLESMGVDADPQTVFERTRASLQEVVGAGGGLLDRWRRTGALAQSRNDLTAGAEANGGTARADRGWAWRLRQTLKGEEHLGRKERVTSVLLAGGSATGAGLQVASHPELGADASDQEIDAFVAAVTVEELEAELAARPQRNSPEMVDLLLELLQRKIAATATAATP